MEKLAKAKERFEKENQILNVNLEAIQAKVDMILNDISFKFTQDVEYKFYSDINAIFN